MNNEFRKAPEGTTHKSEGGWYKLTEYTDAVSSEDVAINVWKHTKWSYTEILLSDYLNLEPRKDNLWYDFEAETTINFPTKSDKFLYDELEACIISTSADAQYPIMECVDQTLQRLTVDDLEFITPMSTPEVEKRLEHTLRGQGKLMRKFLKKANVVGSDTLEAVLEGLYDKGWRVNKTDNV